MRTLNLTFLVILLVGLALFGGALHLVHGIQMQRNATVLLERARRAEAEDRLAEAEKALSWYVNIRPQDGQAWAWYARIVDRRDVTRAWLWKSYLIHQEALRHESNDRELKRRAADLAMELNQYAYGNAALLLNELLEKAPA